MSHFIFQRSAKESSSDPESEFEFELSILSPRPVLQASTVQVPTLGTFRSEQCWLPLFKEGILVYGFPIPTRSQQAVGLQLDFPILALLSQVQGPIEYNSVLASTEGLIQSNTKLRSSVTKQPYAEVRDNGGEAAFDVIFSLGDTDIGLDKKDKTFKDLIDEYLKLFILIRKQIALAQASIEKRFFLPRLQGMLVIFGKNFGQLIQPDAKSKVCDFWNPIPEGARLLTASMRCVMKIADDCRENDASGVLCRWLAEGKTLEWFALEGSKMYDYCHNASCNGLCMPIQILQPPSMLAVVPRKHSPPKLIENDRAVIFGDPSDYYRAIKEKAKTLMRPNQILTLQALRHSIREASANQPSELQQLHNQQKTTSSDIISWDEGGAVAHATDRKERDED
ncbi:hypothetical protein G7Y89_g1961 [Cudoniella acicularis]|uniref:Uncharacterized protein n=1 Tax=Cudoniella acicularis TaxID=354080 RepID=A0A8H4RUA6_9HELO|nr:hypothetical protein G7Y89_g1961 [Cudoniella acicularis]